MKYYLDCEFDGHNGPLLSMALVRQDGEYAYVATNVVATDPWVIENVVPMIGLVEPLVVNPEEVGPYLLAVLEGDHSPTIIADSVVDIGRFCRAISTGLNGQWASVDGHMRFEVHDVNCYPTGLVNAMQHNAYWDAMALRWKLTQLGR